jgi:hypothetical protein
MQQVNVSFTFVVIGALTVTSAPPANPVQGQSYSHQFTATGGTSPYSWAVTAGALPPGMSLSAAGLLSGTPTASGSYPVTVTVSDAG